MFPNGLDIHDAIDLLRPFAVYVIGMAVYALFVFKFYRFVASRDMFELNLPKYEESRFRWVRAFLQVTMYTAKYIILFPVVAFFWFAVLTLILTFLSKGQSFPEVLLMALATVTAIRVSRVLQRRPVPKTWPRSCPSRSSPSSSSTRRSSRYPSPWRSSRRAGDYRENILYYLVFPHRCGVRVAAHHGVLDVPR